MPEATSHSLEPVSDWAMHVGGVWLTAAERPTRAVHNPATGDLLGHLPLATSADLDAALAAAERGFQAWRKVSAYERSALLRQVAQRVREHAPHMAQCLTLEQGKPLAEALAESRGAADHIEWYAEEGRRAYGRTIPSRAENVRQTVLRDPVGPVAAFTPWNFPVGQAVRKIAAALAAGCSIVIKGPEETPRSCIELVRCFVDAGLPEGVLNLVFGEPAEVSARLIASPVIRKVSFTGSVPVGKSLAAQAALQMKRTTMELGGHAPFIVFDDADIDLAVRQAVMAKFRNAGQVCASPTRFFVQRGVYAEFVSRLSEAASQLRVGDGLSPDTQIGPLVSQRRRDAVQALVDDALQRGATARTGGQCVGATGYFFAPTVLENIPADARVLHEEPFGPLALMLPFDSADEAYARANALPFALAAYAFSRSASECARAARTLEAGVVAVNHTAVGLSETPFGGLKDSGHGSEGGSEGLDAYLVTRLVSEAA